MPSRFPPWLHKKLPAGGSIAATREVLAEQGLHTVCQSARCPNQGECFASGTATFLILGDRCTRACTFCAVEKGKPVPLDPQEPERVALAAATLNLSHVVITSVTRDDLPDGGATHFAAILLAVRRKLPAATTEVLTPDFQGRAAAIDTVTDGLPDIYNHNVETVPRLYPDVRPGADYRRSLNLLARVKERAPEIYTKSGLMVGLGENVNEVETVLKDLRTAGCDLITIGQYLQPSPRHVPIARYVTPEEFAAYRTAALELGFRQAEAGPFVRSSYRAKESLSYLKKNQRKKVADGEHPGCLEIDH